MFETCFNYNLLNLNKTKLFLTRLNQNWDILDMFQTKLWRSEGI